MRPTTPREKKRLLVTASTLPRWEDDTEPRFVLDLAKAMKDEYDITILAPAAIGAAVDEYLEGIHVIRYHYFPLHKLETLCYPGAIVPRIREKKCRIILVPFLFLSLYIKLFQILPEYDLVHAHWIIPQGIVQSFFKKPYIVTGHGGDVTSLNKGLLRKLKIRCLQKAEHVTVVSHYLKEQVEKLTHVKNIDVISMGCNIENFGPQFRVDNYFGQRDKKVVLFVGRLAEKKGVTYLVEAMKGIDALLVVVGDGPLRLALIKQAEESGIEFKFLGPKTHEELKVIYASADIFVVPSIRAKDGDMEGIPTTIMEAMASGLPVIASKSGGIVELINDNVNGYLYKEKNVDELSEYISNSIINTIDIRMQEEIKKTIQNFDYKNIGIKYNYIAKNTVCNI